MIEERLLWEGDRVLIHMSNESLVIYGIIEELIDECFAKVKCSDEEFVINKNVLTVEKAEWT